MKLVAITRILNEADIIEAFVRHTGALVDHHILLDNGSIDATLDILRALQAEGLGIEVRHNVELAFAEAEQLNSLFRLAAGEHRADWVLPLDADEFVDLRGNAEALRSALPAGAPDAVKVRVREYIPTPGDDAHELLVPARIAHARPPTDNMKVIARGNLLARGADLRPGGHSIRLDGMEVPWRVLDGVAYAHYATRSPWQWITKFVIGWSRVLAAGPAAIASGDCVHYRDPFRILKDNPAAILGNPGFMEFRHGERDLTADPLSYRGAGLRYTRPVDHRVRAVQALLTHLENLSVNHGELAAARARGGLQEITLGVLPPVWSPLWQAPPAERPS